ncbi:iron-containing alcohol dehydrogenase [Paenibacillus sp. tmac-D7]|uniref:iron-containing alcohol dehydrogenase n=1 Tax=Paenibacillus sp. tmac-D7 TaxID=2591462 RepID=UPI0015E869B2|nr:iron-containing alcohol dehydrogenase [Paenibacillus sp. tmac-D7]
MSSCYRFIPVEKVFHGAGVIENLPAEIDRLGARKAALLTSNSLFASPVIKRLEQLLGSRLEVVLSGTVQHAPSQSIFEIASRLRDRGIDLLISLGGGTVIDSAKAIALVLGEGLDEPQQLQSYSVKFEYPDKIEIPQVKQKLIPHIAVPTTLSAAEFSNIIGITDEHRKVKELYIDDQLTPKVVYMDPELCTDTPDWLWSATGMRALDHAIETVYSKQTHPITTALALQSIRLLSEYLPKCKKDPADLQAKLQCQMAAWMSFFGVSNVMMGLSHGIGHQIGAHANVAHGVTSCIMLPHVMRFSLPFTLEQQALISAAMGGEVSGRSVEEAAAMASQLVVKLVADLELPLRLRDVQVRKEQFQPIAEDAMRDLVVASSPRPVQGTGEIVALLEAAW